MLNSSFLCQPFESKRFEDVLSSITMKRKILLRHLLVQGSVSRAHLRLVCFMLSLPGNAGSRGRSTHDTLRIYRRDRIVIATVTFEEQKCAGVSTSSAVSEPPYSRLAVWGTNARNLEELWRLPDCLSKDPHTSKNR